MSTTTKILSLAVAAAALVSPVAGAQNLAIYGGAEASGLGEGNAILGASLSTGRNGWNPIAGANVQRFTYRSGTGKVTRNAFVPSLGMQYRTDEGSLQGNIGYAFVSDANNPAGVALGSTAGSSSGVVLGVQGNYWANNQEHQAIVSYNTASEYLWSRFRAARRINPGSPDVPVYLGGELVYQGGPVKTATPRFDARRIQFGPTINFHFTPKFHLGAQGGYRTSTPNGVATGYARLEFLILTPLGGGSGTTVSN